MTHIACCSQLCTCSVDTVCWEGFLCRSSFVTLTQWVHDICKIARLSKNRMLSAREHVRLWCRNMSDPLMSPQYCGGARDLRWHLERSSLKESFTSLSPARTHAANFLSFFHVQTCLAANLSTVCEEWRMCALLREWGLHLWRFYFVLFCF